MIDYYYCDSCDKTIKQKSRNSHIKTKTHKKMKSYVRENHFIGDVIWEDFDEIIGNYINANRKKFPIFITQIKCNLYEQDIKFRFDRTNYKFLYYSFGDNVFKYLHPVSKTIHNYIRYQAKMMKKELFPKTIIKNISITFYSYYYIMTRRHKLEQPRRILESKLLKHMHYFSDAEKITYYPFILFKYNNDMEDDISVYSINNEY